MDKMPTRTVVVFHLRREEYPLFLAFVQPDPRLPADYGDWYKANARSERAHRFSGLNVRQVTVRYYDFNQYVRKIKLAPSYALLQAYAVYVAANPGFVSEISTPATPLPEPPPAPIRVDRSELTG